MDRDLATILDIVLTSRKLTGFVAGQSFADLESDTQLQYAVLHAIAIIGEASNRLSPELRAHHPEIPWGEITGTRNRIIHGYDQILLDVIWDIATDKIARVLAELEPLVPTAPESNP